MSETKTVTLKIDGVEVTVEKGKKLYDACTKAGIYLPGLCYDPKLTRFGGCRLCIVDVTARGRTRAKWACCEPASDGVEVTTNTEKIRKKQQVMMEFLLAAHPLDCPTCNASGACGLQDSTFFIKQKRGRIQIKRRNEPLLIDNPVIERDYNKCIMCGKCVVICDEVQGNGAIGFQDRGYDAEVGTPFRIPLDCDFCGQCLHVCPTGSFQDHTELYKGHSWEYDKTSTVCPYCAVGCSIVVNVKKGQIVKNTGNDWIGVNNGNLCARGRFGHGSFQSEDRIKTPLRRRGKQLEETDWSEAMSSISGRLAEIIESHGPDSVAVIAGETLTNEEAYVLQKVFRGLKVNRIQTMSNMRSPSLNSEAFDRFGSSAPVASYDEIKKADAFLFFGCDAEKENPVIANMVRPAMRDNLTPLYVANSRKTVFLPKERQRLTYNYGSETTLLAALIKKIAEGGFDLSQAADRVENPDSLTATAKGVDINEAAKVSGASDGEIASLAEALAKSKAPLIFLGKEIHDHPMAADIVAAVSNLANLLGGKTLLYKEYCNTQGLTDMGVSSSHFPGYKKVDDAQAVAHYSEKWGFDVSNLSNPDAGIFDELKDGKIKALYIANCDPVTDFPDGQFVRESIQQAGFLVVTGPYKTETSKLADVVLPTCVAVERDGSYTNNEGRSQLLRQAIPSVHQSREEWAVIQDIGDRLGVSLSYKSTAGIADEISETVPGYEGASHKKISWGGALIPYPGREDKAKGFEFSTSSSGAQGDPAFPYVALVGNSLFHLGAASHHSPALRKIDPRASVEVNPRDAEKEGLYNGDEASVESKQGSVKVKVKVTERSPEGVVFISKNFDGAPAAHLVYRNDPVTRVKLISSKR